MQNTMYGASFPNVCVMGPPIVGPNAQPIPKTVSYAPIILPVICFLVLLKIISKVSGKKILNPKPIRTKAIPNSIIESAKTDNANPTVIDIVAAINVLLVFFANFPAKASDTTRDIPKTKYNNKMFVAVIPLSLRNAGKIVRIIPKDDVEKINKTITSGNRFICLIAEREIRS